MPNLPYFVPSPGPETVGAAPEDFVHALAVARALSPNGLEEDVVLGVDTTGSVGVVSLAEAGVLAAPVQRELAYHEVSGGVLLPLAAHAWWMFTIDVVEQMPDAAGLNDPLCLYGTLVGPMPRAAGLEVPAVRGQLTVTRADLLDGLCAGAARAFLTPRAPGAGRDGARVVHALLPGDRPETIGARSGLVVALPLVPAELASETAANEIVVAQLLFDVLSALVTDAQASAPSSPLARMQLPVPSRAQLAARLGSEGYDVEGEWATRRTPEGSGIVAVLGKVAHALAPTRVRLPPEGGLDAFVALAAEALGALPNGCCPATAAWRRAPAIAARARGRAAAFVSRTPHAARPPRAPSDADWVAELVGAHADARRPRPVVARPARVVDPRAQPAWMKDFEPAALPPSSRRAEAVPAGTSPDEPAAKDAQSAAKDAPVVDDARPDWMRDFE